MKRTLKVIGYAVLALVLLAVVAVLSLPIWISPVACAIANRVVPSKTGTQFHLGKCQVNPYRGSLAVGDMQLFNPLGFKQNLAVTLGSLTVDVDMSTVLSDAVVIREVEINEVFVACVKNSAGEYNFDVIKRNVDGGKVSKPAEPAAKSTPPAENRAQAEKGSRKVIIDRIRIANVLVQWGSLTLPVPPITLTGIGSGNGGIELDQAWAAIYAQFLKSMGAVGVSLSDLGVSSAEMTKALQDAGVKQVDKAMDAIKNINIKGGADKSLKAVDGLKDGAVNALEQLKGFLK